MVRGTGKIRCAGGAKPKEAEKERTRLGGNIIEGKRKGRKRKKSKKRKRHLSSANSLERTQQEKTKPLLSEDRGGRPARISSSKPAKERRKWDLLFRGLEGQGKMTGDNGITDVQIKTQKGEEIYLKEFRAEEATAGEKTASNNQKKY